jgi:hypothetical protein
MRLSGAVFLAPNIRRRLMVVFLDAESHLAIHRSLAPPEPPSFQREYYNLWCALSTH